MKATEPGSAPAPARMAATSASLEELRDGRAHAPVGLEDQVREPLSAPLLGELRQLVVVLARERLGGTGHAQAAHDATGTDGAREHAELGARDLLADVADLECVAQVGLVGAVAGERLAVGHARERQLDLVTCVAPDLGHQLLGQRQHVLALDEAHLEVELRELQRAIGALGLVTPAAGDLVVAVEAAAHQQLLVELRALRQRVERAGLQPERDHEVARALGRRARHGRSLEVEEAALVQEAADRAHRARANALQFLHSRPAQVEIAMADAQRLVDAFVVELERQHLAGREQLELGDGELDVAGGQLVVARGLAARDQLPARAHDALEPQRMRHGVCLRGALGVDHELHDARAVAQVDEHEPAVIAPPTDPARERQLSSRVLRARLAAQHVPVAAHAFRTLRST